MTLFYNGEKVLYKQHIQRMFTKSDNSLPKTFTSKQNEQVECSTVPTYKCSGTINLHIHGKNFDESLTLHFVSFFFHLFSLFSFSCNLITALWSLVSKTGFSLKSLSCCLIFARFSWEVRKQFARGFSLFLISVAFLYTGDGRIFLMESVQSKNQIFLDLGLVQSFTVI